MSISVSELLAKVPTGILIDDQWCEGSTGETFDVFNPATEEKLATLASATEDDAVAALDAACEAVKSAGEHGWAAKSPTAPNSCAGSPKKLCATTADTSAPPWAKCS